jgi:tetratricopeptide (TPR) repeat protein
MRKLRAPWTLLALAGLAAAAPRARAAGGSDSLEFLLLDGHARPAALGGAYSALAADASALRYNPAGLGLVRANELSATHNQYVQSVRQQQFSAALRSGWGAELNYLDFGKVRRTTLSSPDGTGDSAGLDDLAFSGGYGRRFGDLAVGGAAKYFRENADRTVASGFAGDAGVLWTPASIPALRVGAAVQNAGPDVKYQSLKQKLPTVGRLGAAYSFALGQNDNTFAAEFSRARADSAVLGLGFETVFVKSVAFRLGWTSRNSAGLGLTGGVGWLYDRFIVGYAFSPYGDLGLAHRLTLTLRWGEGASSPEKPVFSQRADPPPGDDLAADLMGEAERRLERGDHAGAIQALDQAEARLGERDPRRVRRLERRATALLRSGKPAPAREAYTDSIKEALRLGVKDAAVTDAYVGLGLISVSEGNSEYALRLFLKALHLEPAPATKAMLETKIADLRSAKDAAR